jgi:hypothetical protein
MILKFTSENMDVEDWVFFSGSGFGPTVDSSEDVNQFSCSIKARYFVAIYSRKFVYAFT